MKKLVSSLTAILLLAGAGFAGGRSSLRKGSQAKGFTGEIMDNMCAAAGSHKGMEDMFHIGDDSKKCTLECVEKGGKFVLYDGAKKAIYQLDDQRKPKEFAGQKVKVTGTYDSKTETIHVEHIEAAP